MDRTRLAPPQFPRLAIFLVAIALVAAISPGLAVAAANGAPKPVLDVITTVEDQPVGDNVLANDINNGSGALTVTNFVGFAPSIGTLTIDANGDLMFTPAAHWTGFVSTTYEVSNDSHSKVGVIEITVTPLNEEPVANDDTVTVDEDTPTDVTALLLDNDTDPDGDTLVVSAVSNPSGGSVQVASNVVTFTPDADLCDPGTGSFDYAISDGNSGTASATVTVNITCINDAPVAVDDSATGTEDTPLVIDPADLLTNDSDVDTGDTLVVTAVSNDDGGTAVLDAGSITFTPDADLCDPGTGSFDYAISDGNSGTASATVTVNITCINDGPVAVDDTGSVANNPGPTDFDVLVNDTDVEGDTRILVSASVSASAGSAIVVAGKVRFTPLAVFSGPAVITYVVSDGALTDSGTLTVTVGPDTVDPVATAPTVQFGTGRVDESAPLLISWSSSDVGSGVVSHELQVSIAGGSFTTVYTGAGTSYAKLFPFNKTLVWRVRATDAATNVSPWATAASRRIVAYQGTNPGFTYTGTWTRVSSAGSSGTDYRYATSLGRRVTLAFTGREVLYVAPKTNSSGYAKVYVDGTLIGRFNLRTSIATPGRIIARATWSANGGHTIRVVNDQAGRKTNLDAFVVLK